VVEFIDLKYKCSSNFKSIGGKLRILEIPGRGKEMRRDGGQIYQ